MYLLDNVYWTEMRFDEGGRYVNCSTSLSQTGYTAWTPGELNARTRVHEYGGGATTVHNGVVYFANFEDQQIYTQKSAEEQPVQLTLEDSKWRYADAEYHEKVPFVITYKLVA